MSGKSTNLIVLDSLATHWHLTFRRCIGGSFVGRGVFGWNVRIALMDGVNEASMTVVPLTIGVGASAFLLFNVTAIPIETAAATIRKPIKAKQELYCTTVLVSSELGTEGGGVKVVDLL